MKMDTSILKLLMREFHDKYKSRITSASPKYGDFDPITDKRNMATEAIEEVLDVGSYLEFGEAMHPHLEPQIQRIRAKTIVLYGLLKELEVEMKTTGKEGDL